eukprot:SAG22_NODE_1000_length_6090_cov_9.522117_4_plen_225_part_00
MGACRHRSTVDPEIPWGADAAATRRVFDVSMSPVGWEVSLPAARLASYQKAIDAAVRTHGSRQPAEPLPVIGLLNVQAEVRRPLPPPGWATKGRPEERQLAPPVTVGGGDLSRVVQLHNMLDVDYGLRVRDRVSQLMEWLGPHFPEAGVTEAMIQPVVGRPIRDKGEQQDGGSGKRAKKYERTGRYLVGCADAEAAARLARAIHGSQFSLESELWKAPKCVRSH